MSAAAAGLVALFSVEKKICVGSSGLWVIASTSRPSLIGLDESLNFQPSIFMPFALSNTSTPVKSGAPCPPQPQPEPTWVLPSARWIGNRLQTGPSPAQHGGL